MKKVLGIEEGDAQRLWEHRKEGSQTGGSWNMFLIWDPEGMSWGSPGRAFKARGSRASESLRSLVNGASEGIGLGRAAEIRPNWESGDTGHINEFGLYHKGKKGVTQSDSCFRRLMAAFTGN